MRRAKSITLNDIVNHPVRRILAGARYAAFRKGPLTIAAGTSGAFFKTNPRLATPDIQIHFLPFSTDKMGEKLHAQSGFTARSEEHTSELQSHLNLVCRLLLEKKKKKYNETPVI